MTDPRSTAPTGDLGLLFPEEVRMFGGLWLALVASAADDPAEEVVVWGDRFARWERRWYVETEYHSPQPLRLLGWTTGEIDAVSVQVRAVLACDKDVPLGPKTWEVHCDVEDIGLAVMPRIAAGTDAALVAEADATLTDASIQLQVSELGGVPNIDLENVAAHDDRSRLRQEQLRQLMGRVIVPFHLALPESVHPGAKWYEYDSRLMSTPSERGSSGGTSVAHYLDVVSDGLFVVQSIGHGTVIPIGGTEVAQIDAQTGEIVGMVGGVHDTFALDMHGVAVIQRDTGIMSERVWVVSGGLTASSPNALSQDRYYHAGRIRMLGETERPDVGPTAVASRPGGQDPGRPAWVRIEP